MIKEWEINYVSSKSSHVSCNCVETIPLLLDKLKSKNADLVLEEFALYC